MSISEKTGKNMGLELKLLRIRLGLKQYYVASKLGVAPNRLCEMELGRRPIPTELLETLTRVLDEAQKTKTEA